MSHRSWADLKKRQNDGTGSKDSYSRAMARFEVGSKIRDLRLSKGLSQGELAKKTGSSQPSIARLEAGWIAPTVDTLVKIAKALDSELEIQFNRRRGRKVSGTVGSKSRL